jgi:hypothetical protein
VRGTLRYFMLSAAVLLSIVAVVLIGLVALAVAASLP